MAVSVGGGRLQESDRKVLHKVYAILSDCDYCLSSEITVIP